METFIAIDIFDTKGTEYIFVIGYLLLLVAFWQIFWKPSRIKRKVKEAIGSLSASVLRIPQGLFFGKNHTWTHLDRSGVASVGLDDLLQHITGDVEFNHHKKPGEQISKGELLTEIIHNGNTLKISSPISGNIVNTNSLLKDQRDALSEDPYGKAWIYKIRPTDWKAETSSYYIAGEATIWIKKELERIKDFLAESMKKHSPDNSMIIMQDGGELRDNTLSGLPKEVWNDFQDNFLNDI